MIIRKDWDALVIALYVDNNDRDLASLGGFDGIYTYFATDGFTMVFVMSSHFDSQQGYQGSTTKLWNETSKWAHEHNLLWIPCVGPGYILFFFFRTIRFRYDDTRIRPWNARNKRPRNNGKYYENMWETAINSEADFVGITSFNEWHEGKNKNIP